MKFSRFSLGFSLLFLSLGWQKSLHAQGYHPDHPEVVAMTETLIGVLEGNVNSATSFRLTDPHSGAYGEMALAAYAHHKVNYDKRHPVVERGIEAAMSYSKQLNAPNKGDANSKAVYQAAICALLLADVDPLRYRSQLKAFNSYLKRVQFNHGGYSYPLEPAGDVSQTQYVMLCLWKLDRLNINIDDKGVAKTGQWLLKVQDVGGGWPYQGVVPSGGGLIKQNHVTPSMALAGGGALLIAGDILRSWGATFGEADDPGIPDLPKAVKLYVGGDGSAGVKVKANLPAEKLRAAVLNCDRWLASNSPDPGVHKAEWPMYQLYTLERFKSFREVAFEEPEGKSPGWYNDGVTFVKNSIAGNKISTSKFVTESTGASFAILFLIRSTKKSIAAFSGGAMTGGRDLPDDTSDIKVTGSQIKSKNANESLTDMLKSFESASKVSGMSIPENLKLSSDPKEKAAQLDRLKRLARGSQSWQARRVALRLLGQSDDLELVPTLIYGLGDRDKVCRIYARDGLRFISRKFDGFGMSPNATENEIYSYVDQWKEWYLSIRPDHVFID